MTDLRFQLHRIVEVVVQVHAELLELGGFLDLARLGTEIDVVEHAVYQPVLVIDLGLTHRDLGLATEVGGTVQVGADGVLALVLVQLRVHRIEAQQRVVGHLELERAGDAEPFDFMRGADVARIARDPCIGGGFVGGDVFRGGFRARQAGTAMRGADAVAAPAVVAVLVGLAAAAGRGFVGGRVAWCLRVVAERRAETVGAVVGGIGLVGITVVAMFPTHRVVAFLVDVALAVGRRQQGTETPVTPGVAEQPRETRIVLLGQFTVTGLRRGRCLETIEVERTRAAQVHRRTQRAFVHLRRLGLVDLDLAEELGSKGVEVETTAAVDAAAAIAGGGQGLQSVQAHAGEIRAQAADGDALPFPTLAVD
ncbi:hypothetical protein D3C81_742540 [compost metagenome]